MDGAWSFRRNVSETLRATRAVCRLVVRRASLTDPELDTRRILATGPTGRRGVTVRDCSGEDHVAAGGGCVGRRGARGRGRGFGLRRPRGAVALAGPAA